MGSSVHALVTAQESQVTLNHAQALLGGSWVVRRRATSRITIVKTQLGDL